MSYLIFIAEQPIRYRTSWVTTASNEQITLPLQASGSYDFIVDWGDNSGIDYITAYNQAETTHTYVVAGTYTVSIRGLINGFAFDGAGDISKIRDVLEWGSVWVVQDMFRGATGLTSSLSPIDVPINIATDISEVFDSTAVVTVANLNSWNVSGVLNTRSMFAASDFNQDISAWDITSLDNMNGMFSGSSLTYSVSAWDTSSVTTMQTVFANSPYNAPLDWDVSNVIYFDGMFSGNTVFNQDISAWDTSSAGTFSSMFSGATSFDQNIGGWTISSLVAADNMFNAVTLSETNYDSLLAAWGTSSKSPNDDVVFSGGNSIYCSAEAVAGRDYLVTTKNWTVTDGGKCPSYFYDDFAASTVGLSLRKLISTATNCIRVRRASDSTLLVIGFDGDDLDTAAIETFCSGTTGYVETWYGQNGTWDYTQPTAANQPRIYASGAILTSNGKPVVDFTNVGNHCFMRTTSTANRLASNQAYNTHAVITINSNPIVFYNWVPVSNSTTNPVGVVTIYQGASGGDPGYGFQKPGVNTVFPSPQVVSDNVQQIQQIWNRDGTGTAHHVLYLNDELEATVNGTGTATSGTSYSMIGTSNLGFRAKLQELIVYANFTQTEQADMAANINAYWGVY